MTYTAFDKPEQINHGTTYVRVTYGPDRKRFRRGGFWGCGAVIVTHYAGSKAFERIDDATNNPTDLA